MAPGNILLINRDEDESGADMIPLSISEVIPNYSLFEGEIVCLEGTLDQKQFVIERVIKPKPIAKVPRPIIGKVKMINYKCHSGEKVSTCRQ